MKWFKQMFWRSRLYGDLSEEIRQHLEEKVEELVSAGMSRKDASAAAHREFGNLTLAWLSVLAPIRLWQFLFSSGYRPGVGSNVHNWR